MWQPRLGERPWRHAGNSHDSMMHFRSYCIRKAEALERNESAEQQSKPQSCENATANGTVMTTSLWELVETTPMSYYEESNGNKTQGNQKGG